MNKYSYLVTIITVVYNGEQFIKKTIDSVGRLKTRDIEYLIVDGGSTDATVAIIEGAGSVVDKFISESDNGIFDAMNKGIKLAQGQWLVFINAGDQILPDALTKINLKEKAKYGIVYGNTIRGKFERTYPYREELITTGNLPMCHQSTLYNRAVLKEEMQYKSDYRLFSENELFMRVFSQNIPTCYTDVDVSYFLGGGVSSSISSETRKAKYNFLYKYFGVKGVVLAVLLKVGLLNKSTYQLRAPEKIENDGLVLT